MAIKVTFTSGASSVTVSGLHQWDYGQTLEIECAELGSEIVEVHFACSGMSEAIVRSCTFSNGVGTVNVPDTCLEQTSNITAWIYKVSGTQGYTIKTITLPVIARTRPSKSYDVSATYVDKYAEALTAVNTAIDNLENGTVTVAKATHATSADKATTATNASSASYATSAGSANHATTTTKVMISKDSPYCSISITDGSGHTETNFVEGLFLVTYDDGGTVLSGVGYIGKNSGSTNSYIISLGKIALLYDEYASETTASGSGAGVSLLVLDESSPVISKTGTLKFFRFGGFSVG